MEEKILIKSKTNTAVKKFLKFTSIICFAIAALCSILLSLPIPIEPRFVGWERMVHFYEFTVYFILFILGSLCLIVSIVTGIIYLVTRKCELQIFETTVKGKALYGKKVVLPLYMISAHSTRNFLSVVSIATASGIMRFSLIENYKEISDVLSQLISQRQRSTQVEATQPSPKSDSMNDLIKLKSLLDSGVITQEEFDAKKKQLLGL